MIKSKHEVDWSRKIMKDMIWEWIQEKPQILVLSLILWYYNSNKILKDESKKMTTDLQEKIDWTLQIKLHGKMYNRELGKSRNKSSNKFPWDSSLIHYWWTYPLYSVKHFLLEKLNSLLWNTGVDRRQDLKLPWSNFVSNCPTSVSWIVFVKLETYLLCISKNKQRDCPECFLV